MIEDMEFITQKVAKVTQLDDGWELKFEDGWHLFIDNPPITPEAGMEAKLYGRGIGYNVRGLFLNGHRVWYRTQEEDKEYREIQMYGKDAQDWIDRLDKGDFVWTITMGGMGPGYEQAIQITVAEILRHLLVAAYDYDMWYDMKKWEKDRDAIDKAVSPKVEYLGLSGAQWGAALSLAISLYVKGPRALLTDKDLDGRKIMFQKYFPQGI